MFVAAVPAPRMRSTCQGAPPAVEARRGRDQPPDALVFASSYGKNQKEQVGNHGNIGAKEVSESSGPRSD
jgi:hypothetical protein